MANLIATAASDRFNWDDEDIVICREQPKSAVYPNPFGQICIRQERAWDQDEDTFLVFNPETLPALIAALKAYL